MLAYVQNGEHEPKSMAVGELRYRISADNLRAVQNFNRSGRRDLTAWRNPPPRSWARRMGRRSILRVGITPEPKLSGTGIVVLRGVIRL